MGNNPRFHAVTGAFGYSGRYIAARLLAAGQEVLTLTNSPHRPNPFGSRIRALPLSSDDPARLASSLAGVQVLYNTYWVRFNHRDFTHAQAVRNTEALFEAARQAGVERVVHISITNPDEHSALEYFAGKGRLERALVASGLSHAILRPAVLFGGADILINNIAWALRRFPVFPIFGDGRDYGLQPIHVDDLAELAVKEGASRADTVVNAIGPETYTYRELVEMIARGIGRRPLLLNVSPGLGYVLGRVIGFFMSDTFITREEIRGLMAGLLQVQAPPAGRTRLSDWVGSNRDTLGRSYAGELQRRRDRTAAYGTA